MISRLHSGLLIGNNTTFCDFCQILSHEYSGQKPTPNPALIRLRTDSKFILSNTISGEKPASKQLSYVTEAYPIVVFCKQLENKQRRMMEIMECEILPNGDRRYNTLFRYVITENHMENGKFVIEGHHTQVNEISVSLRKRLLENGMPNEELQALLNPKKEVNAT